MECLVTATLDSGKVVSHSARPLSMHTPLMIAVDPKTLECFIIPEIPIICQALYLQYHSTVWTC